jgi:hypothetical protein
LSIRITLSGILLSGLVTGFIPHVQAEELEDIFGRVNGFVGQKNYSKALEELEWARKELEKLHTRRLQSFFPDQLGEYKGAPAEVNGALGFTNVERRYSNGSSSVTVSLIGQSGGAAGGLGGLAALGKMAAMFGQQAGQDSFRISGRTAILNKTPGSSSADLTVFLDSGSMLKIEDATNGDTAVLRSLAEKLDIGGLEKYLKGEA